MSACMVSEGTIRYLVAAGLRPGSADRLHWWHEGKPRQLMEYDLEPGDTRPDASYVTPSELGRLLWEANAESIRARYPHDADMVGPGGACPWYEHRPAHWPYEPVQTLKSCDCFEYQACEAETWEASEAKAVIQALRRAAGRALPGYEAADWGAPAFAEVGQRPGAHGEPLSVLSLIPRPKR